MNEFYELQTPVTEREIAELNDGVRAVPVMSAIVRRMAFELDRRREENKRLELACDVFEKNSSNAAELSEMLRQIYYNCHRPRFDVLKGIYEKLQEMFGPLEERQSQ